VEYLILLLSILLACIIVNLRFKLQIFESTKQAVVVLVSLSVIGVVLDSFAVIRGYWSYNTSGNFFVGIKIGILPLEEYDVHDSHSLYDFNNFWANKKTCLSSNNCSCYSTIT